MRTKAEIFSEATDADLLNTFFASGGKMNHEGFLVPAPMSYESSECHFSFIELSNRLTGVKLLEDVHNNFKKGDVDCYNAV